MQSRGEIMERRSLVVPKKIMDEVSSNSSFLLKVPTDAHQRGVGEDATYAWSEHLKVMSTGVTQDAKNAGTFIVQVDIRVDESSPQNDNIGRAHNEQYR